MQYMHPVHDSDALEQWMLGLGGRPMIVEDDVDSDSGILRIDIAEDIEGRGKDDNEEGGSVVRSSRSELLRIFKIIRECELSFLYQEKGGDGSLSRFFRFGRA